MILIIDDDSAIRSSLSFMLKRAKYEVQAVAGPREAIEIVRSVAPQLILMDMNFTLFYHRRRRIDAFKASEDIPARCSCDIDDRMGKHSVGCSGYAGRCF